VKIGDYALSNADLVSGNYTIGGRVWTARKSRRHTDKSRAIASAVVKGTHVRLEVSDHFRMGEFYIGNIQVEGLILDSDNIKDAKVRALVEEGYLALRAAMEASVAAEVARRRTELDKDLVAKALREAERAAAIKKIS
jgi:hypothetical protein